MIEKLIEFHISYSGLTIASSKRKSPKSLEALRILDLVPVTGLEPVRHRWRWILSSLRYSAVDGFERQATALKVFEKPPILLDLLIYILKISVPQHFLKTANFARKKAFRRALGGQ